MKLTIIPFLFALITLTTCNNSEKNHPLCRKPPMGYNSWDSYRTNLNQEIAIKLIDVMAEKYLKSGYEYFVIDMGWYIEHKVDSATGLPVSSREKRKLNIDQWGLPEPSVACFSNGIKSVADYAHKKGLKFGVHLMRGAFRQAVEQNCKVKGTDILLKDIVDTLSICTWSNLSYGVDMSKPGSAEYYNSLIEKMASWHIDFIKYDDITGMPKELNAIVSAIRKCGRPIALSLSPGEDTKLQFLPYYENTNMLRITADIWDYQRSLNNGFTAMKAFQGRGYPGFWPDLDMLALGPLDVLSNSKRLSRFTRDQAYTFITQRAIFASPLFIGGDMLTMDNFTYSLLTDESMIDCDQNGVTGLLTFNNDSVEIYVASDKSEPAKGWLAVFNRKIKSDTVTLKKPDFGFNFNRPGLNNLMKDYQLHDIWNNNDLSLTDSLKITIPGNGVFFAGYNEKR